VTQRRRSIEVGDAKGGVRMGRGSVLLSPRGPEWGDRLIRKRGVKKDD